MLKWIKNLFKSDDDYNYNDYVNFVTNKSKNNSYERFAVFSGIGFNTVMELLLERITYTAYMFIERRELFFDPLKLSLLENKINLLNNNGGQIIIATFNGITDPIFKQLEDKHPNSFKYISLKCNNVKDVNSFIIIDNKSYLIDDPKFNHRGSILDTLKAEVNFFDYSKTNDLINKFKQYVGITTI